MKYVKPVGKNLILEFGFHLNLRMKKCYYSSNSQCYLLVDKESSELKMRDRTIISITVPLDLLYTDQFDHITTIDLSYNNLSTIDLSIFSQLRNLDISHNDLTSIDITMLPHLRNLDISYNKVFIFYALTNRSQKYLILYSLIILMLGLRH